MKIEQTDKKYNIVVDRGAFDRNIQRNQISSKKVAFNSTLSKMNRAVEELDRFDDFAFLKIDVNKYRKKDNSKYGIVFDPKIHTTGTVILDHQKNAASLFLKELRGFGLLADVVGSGKTYEACVVISELAVRNKIKSMLIIVPSQVYAKWITTLENEFGLGEGVLNQVKGNLILDENDYACNNGVLVPYRPIIVDVNDFVNWPLDTAKYMFDLIVVDEAHHLCEEDGKYAQAMKLLSLMMKTKKKAKGGTYCVLLSATPHSGNLEHMFRLWYFVRCKGGNPDDFDKKDEKDCTQQFLSEKKYYKEHVCRGASTVMEFIENVKFQEVRDNPRYKKIVNDYMDYIRYNKDDENESTLKIIGNRKYDELSYSEKMMIINKTLYFNENFNNELAARIAAQYHNGVLRSIMIRQPKPNIAKRKKVKNILFYPTTAELSKFNTTGINEDQITVDPQNITNNAALSLKGKEMSIKDYIDGNCGNRTYNQVFAELMIDRILGHYGEMNKSNGLYIKKHSHLYYKKLFSECPSDIENTIYPIKYVQGDLISHKIAKTKELLYLHKDERVIIFFDYDVKKEERIYDKVEEELRKDPEINKRLIIGSGEKEQVKAIEKIFNEKSDAILFVKSAHFTEGANLQKCCIIINFQVTPDPLAMDQRCGRVFRLGQENDVTIYSLANMQQLEGYVLLYYLIIGLLGENFGDATIIAGSNSDRNITVRCSSCGRVQLLSREEYESKVKNDDLYCAFTNKCVQDDKRGTKMQEICVYDFKCSNCGKTFTRSITEGGYRCISSNNSGSEIMCNSGKFGDRNMYCRKICSIAHCSFFKSETMKGKCLALEMYKKNHNISDNDLMTICADCTNKVCKKKCQVSTLSSAISGCSTCEYSECSPKPHVLSFNEKWEAVCPDCRDVNGKIKPIIARTFAAYICGAWNFNHDNGESFCPNLLNETKKVSLIKKILEMDSLN